MSTLTQPETRRQAQRHESTTNRYRVAGLCTPCAAQAAYGHQHGFSTVQRPCPACRPVVAGLPVAKCNGWRSLVSETGFTDRLGEYPTSGTRSTSHGNSRPHGRSLVARPDGRAA